MLLTWAAAYSRAHPSFFLEQSALTLDKYVRESLVGSSDDFRSLMSADHRKQSDRLPKFTKQGYLLLKLPEDLRSALVECFEEARNHSTPERDPSVVEFGDEALRPEYTAVEGRPPERRLRQWLASALQEWSGVYDLVHVNSYGVRSYKRGSKLKPHVDRAKTHVLSAIVHVSRKALDEEWSLDIVPHDSPSVLSILMDEKANCLLYESATIPHGRMSPLMGEEYSNIFFHFYPRGWTRFVEEAL